MDEIIHNLNKKWTAIVIVSFSIVLQSRHKKKKTTQPLQ